MLFAKLFRSSPQINLDDLPDLTAKRIVLRRKRVSDLDDDFKWRVDGELTKLDASLPINLTKEEYRRILGMEINGRLKSAVKLAIDTIADDRHIGNCMLYDINHGKQHAELGIMIGDRNYWDNGYGTEAVTTLVGYAFTTVNLKMLYLHTLADNIRAQKCFAKAGFEPAVLMERNGNQLLRMSLTYARWVDFGKLPVNNR